jgi:hypothetical protein
MTIIKYYRNSQKYRLLDSIRILCKELNRPVSSKDAAAFWNTHPGLRPILTQAIGQLLIKSSRIASGDTPRIFRVGLIGNLAFYAPDASSYWNERLEIHRSILRIRWHNRLQIPWHAQMLIGGKYHPLAISALTGFIEEWRRFTKNPESETYAVKSPFIRMLDFAIREAGNVLWCSNSPSLITRVDAEKILREEYASRFPFVNADSLSANKHLGRLAWPLSPLFNSSGFLPKQARLYCAARWPNPEEDSVLASARWHCLTYTDIG